MVTSDTLNAAGLISMIFPRAYSSLMKGCKTITSPSAFTTAATGFDPGGSPSIIGDYDTTQIGSDYKLTW